MRINPETSSHHWTRPFVAWGFMVLVISGLLILGGGSRIGAEVLAPASPTPPTATNLVQAREDLERALKAALSAKGQTAAPKTRVEICNKARELLKIGMDLFQHSPEVTSKLEAEDQLFFAQGLVGLLDVGQSSKFWSLVESTTSCLSASALRDAYSVSEPKASKLRAHRQQILANAVLEAMPIGLINYYGVLRFAERAEPEPSAEVARAILRADAPDLIKAVAQTILDRKAGIGLPLRLDFTSPENRGIDLAQEPFRGNVVLVDIWATDCPPCMAQLPELKTLEERYHDQGLSIVGINADSDPKRAERALKQHSIKWPNFLSSAGMTNKHLVAFGVSALPDVLLIDRNGILRETGGVENLEKKIQMLLREPVAHVQNGKELQDLRKLNP